MQSKTENGRVTILLEPRIDTNNYEAVEAEIEDIMKKSPGCGLTLDAKNLEYISSAGLRAILKIKKELGDVEIVDVSRDVYDIFDVTGFTGAMPIKRAIREFSIEGLDKVGQGGTAAVYRLDEDKIIKVFKPMIPVDVIQNERFLAQKLFLAGIPTAVPYDVVKSGENIGVIYEMLKASSLQDLIVNDPANDVKYVHMMADLRKEISGIKVDNLPNIKDTMKGAVVMCNRAGLIDGEQHTRYIAFMDSIPDAGVFIHGDFHPGNVMVVDGELMLIDLSAASVGHAIFDLAGIETYLNSMPDVLGEVGYMHFAGIEPERAKALWREFVNYYFQDLDPEAVRKAEMQIKALSYMRLISGAAVVPDLIPVAKVAPMKEFIDENYDEIMSGLDF